MGNSAPRDVRKAERAELKRKALELRKAGANYDQIAAQLKLANRSVAWKLVRSAIKGIYQEPAQAVATLELERLDALLLGCWSKAKGGDLHAVDRALRIMERRAAFLGLDQPRGLKVEMARELEGFLGRLREEFDDDVYERILALIAGEYGNSPAGQTPVGEEPEEGAGESGGDERPPTAPA